MPIIALTRSIVLAMSTVFSLGLATVEEVLHCNCNAGAVPYALTDGQAWSWKCSCNNYWSRYQMKYFVPILNMYFDVGCRLITRTCGSVRVWNLYCTSSQSEGARCRPNPSSSTMTLGFAQPLTEISTRRSSWEWSAAVALSWQPNRHPWADCLDQFIPTCLVSRTPW
jgi:hypothetical protein